MLSLSPNNNENDASALARNLSSLAGSHVDFSRDLFILNGNDILAGREERFGGKGSVGFSPIRMLSLSISACKLGPIWTRTRPKWRTARQRHKSWANFEARVNTSLFIYFDKAEAQREGQRVCGTMNNMISSSPKKTPHFRIDISQTDEQSEWESTCWTVYKSTWPYAPEQEID